MVGVSRLHRLLQASWGLGGIEASSRLSILCNAQTSLLIRAAILLQTSFSSDAWERWRGQKGRCGGWWNISKINGEVGLFCASRRCSGF